MKKKGTILLTCAGKATRFGRYGGRKWALTHPSGNLMGAEALLSMGLDILDWDIVVAVNSTDAKHFDRRRIALDFARACLDVQVVDVGAPKHRGETIYRALRTQGIESGAVCVRDCDNSLKFQLEPENAVAVCNLAEAGRIDVMARSYVEIDHGRVFWGREHDLLTDWFCAGAYVFESAADLIEVCQQHEHLTVMVDEMIHQGHNFEAREVVGYEDWGTSEDWRISRSSYRTLFVDIDGTLLASGHRTFGATGWGENPALIENCRALQEAYMTGRVHIVLTTARTEEWRRATKAQLKSAGVEYHQLIMGLPAAGRVLINDGVPERGERTADAIELRRDADGDLGGHLRMVGLL